MKRLLIAAMIGLAMTTPRADAADRRVELPLQQLLDSPQAKEAGIDGSVRFYLAGQSHPAVVSKLGRMSPTRRPTVSASRMKNPVAGWRCRY